MRFECFLGKRLAVFLLLVTFFSSFATDVTIPVAFFGGVPATNRTISWQQQTPFVGNVNFITSDSTSNAVILNAPYGLINCVIKAPPAPINFQLWIPSTTLGAVNASNYLASGSSSTYPAGQVAWSILTSDARYQLAGNVQSNLFYPLFSNPSNYVNNTTLLAQSNSIINQVSSVVGINTNWFIPTNSLPSLTNSFISIVPVNLSSNYLSTNSAAIYYPTSNPSAFITSLIYATNSVNNLTNANGFTSGNNSGGNAYNLIMATGGNGNGVNGNGGNGGAVTISGGGSGNVNGGNGGLVNLALGGLQFTGTPGLPGTVNVGNLNIASGAIGSGNGIGFTNLSATNILGQIQASSVTNIGTFWTNAILTESNSTDANWRGGTNRLGSAAYSSASVFALTNGNWWDIAGTALASTSPIPSWIQAQGVANTNFTIFSITNSGAGITNDIVTTSNTPSSLSAFNATNGIGIGSGLLAFQPTNQWSTLIQVTNIAQQFSSTASNSIANNNGTGTNTTIVNGISLSGTNIYANNINGSDTNLLNISGPNVSIGGNNIFSYGRTTNSIAIGYGNFLTNTINSISIGNNNVISPYQYGITGNSYYNIALGNNNTNGGASYSGILGGYGNTLQSQQFETIFGGSYNSGHALYLLICNGTLNSILSPYSVICNGYQNAIGASSLPSFIGTGFNNSCYSQGFIGTGTTNNIFGGASSIINGDINTITGNGNYYDTIITGTSNTISDSPPSIGCLIDGNLNYIKSSSWSSAFGISNTITGYSYASVFGYKNIATQAPGAPSYPSQYGFIFGTSNYMSGGNYATYGSIPSFIFGNFITNSPPVGAFPVSVGGGFSSGGNIINSNLETVVFNDYTPITTKTNQQAIFYFANGVSINTNYAGGNAFRVAGNIDSSGSAAGFSSNGVPLNSIFVSQSGNYTNGTIQGTLSLGGNTNYLAQGNGIVAVIGAGSTSANGEYLQISANGWTNDSQLRLGVSGYGISSNGTSFFINNGSTALYSATALTGPWTVVNGSTPVPSSWIGATNQATGIHPIGFVDFGTNGNAQIQLIAANAAQAATNGLVFPLSTVTNIANGVYSNNPAGYVNSGITNGLQGTNVNLTAWSNWTTNQFANTNQFFTSNIILTAFINTNAINLTNYINSKIVGTTNLTPSNVNTNLLIAGVSQENIFTNFIVLQGADSNQIDLVYQFDANNSTWTNSGSGYWISLQIIHGGLGSPYGVTYFLNTNGLTLFSIGGSGGSYPNSFPSYLLNVKGQWNSSFWGGIPPTGDWGRYSDFSSTGNAGAYLLTNVPLSSITITTNISPPTDAVTPVGFGQFHDANGNIYKIPLYQ